MGVGRAHELGKEIAEAPHSLAAGTGSAVTVAWAGAAKGVRNGRCRGGACKAVEAAGRGEAGTASSAADAG